MERDAVGDVALTPGAGRTTPWVWHRAWNAGLGVGARRSSPRVYSAGKLLPWGMGVGAQQAGRPIRVFYAFDPTRTSILLIGGDKTGNDRFYHEYVPIADDLYDEHLAELRKEGLIE